MKNLVAITALRAFFCKASLFILAIFLQFQLLANDELSPLAGGGTTTGNATVCSGINDGVITLSGQVGVIIRWESSINGAVSWQLISNTTATQNYHNITQTTKYRAVVQNGVSAPVYSTVSTITVTATPSATIAYTGSPYCSTAYSASVTRTGTAGGAYSSTAGLSIAATTGKITIGTSTPGTYTVTYTVPASGGCSVYSTTTAVTITPKPSATISYAGGPFCNNADMVTVTRTGTAGGTYTSTAGLSIDEVTGTITPVLSTAGTYIVTYTVAAADGCAMYTTTTSVKINPAPSATISYEGNPYCANMIVAIVTRTGSSGGRYSSTAGLAINAITGNITIGSSEQGTYLVTYTIGALNGCDGYTTTTSITITAPVSATISYEANPYCTNGGIATITRTGDAGGTYSSTPGLAINPSSGDIELGSSLAGTYTVTYTIAATVSCPAYTKTTSVNILNPLSATISYDGGPFCSAAGNAIVTRTGATGGIYSSTAGLSIAPSTGTITLGTSVAGTYLVTYTMTNAGCITTATTSVTINATPSATIAYAGPYCPGDGIVSVTQTGTSGGTYSAAPGLTIDSITGDINPATSTAGNYSVGYTISATGNCPVYTATASLTIKPALATPGTITGLLDVCPVIGSSVPSIYSIDPVPGATSYTWQLPVGTTLVSGQGTTSIGVVFDNSFAYTNSMFSVTAGALNNCTSEASEVEVLKIVPSLPTVIYGPVNLCDAIGHTSTAVYSIDPVDYAISYTWGVPQGMSILSGQGTTSIEVNISSGFTWGSVLVTSNSNCGNRAPRSLAVYSSLPATPSVISGPANACSYIGNATPVSYSIQPVANADSYTWTIPNNVTLISGQGTTSVTVIFNSGYVTSSIKVRSVVSCGTSSDRSLTVAAVAGLQPGSISGPNNACAFIGSEDSATYTIKRVTNANYYVWSVPVGATIVSHPGNEGINDTIIKVVFDNNFVAGTKIMVQAVNCAPGTARTFAIQRVSPSRPGLISGPLNVCEYMASNNNPAGIPVTYSIRKITGASSYSWTVPTGSTITAHPAGTGSNDTTVQIIFDAGFLRGSISVAAVNGCGAGSARALSLSRLTPSTPGNIDIIQTAFCPNRVYTYTIAALPYNTTTMLWTAPANGTIVSGQGTTSITVSYDAGNVSGIVSAKPYNNCSSGTTRSISIKLPACANDDSRSVQAKGLKTIIAPAGNQFETNIFPNPSPGNCKMQVKTTDRQVITIRVLDISGNLVKAFSIKPYQIISFGNDLMQGTYLIETIQGENKNIQKFVKL